jgi:serine/threonine protein kinase
LVLNQYRLQDQLTSGPMAGAYLAHDALNRLVAIEVLSPQMAADKSVLMGFQQAATKAMEVQHPNVCRILDTGEAHGLHYLVTEYYHGETLEEILQRRKNLPYHLATPIMALALAGLDALHAKGVSAGDLTADCLLLAPDSKQSPKQRTVKILHAGVKRRLFDKTAIGRSISLVQGVPEELQLANSSTFHVSEGDPANPAEDIFRLGCIFYRCVTGQAPFTENELPQPSRPARSIAEIAPEIPEMLVSIIEGMIDPDPSKRPQKAANVAKSLRVFLAAEEHGREAKAEENIVVPSHKALHEQEEGESESVEGEEEEARPGRRIRNGEAVSHEGVGGKVAALWEEVNPDLRDLLFFAGGALGVLLFIFLVELLTGIRIVYVAGLATGIVASYCVDSFVRWRHKTTA